MLVEIRSADLDLGRGRIFIVHRDALRQRITGLAGSFANNDEAVRASPLLAHRWHREATAGLLLNVCIPTVDLEFLLGLRTGAGRGLHRNAHLQMARVVAGNLLALAGVREGHGLPDGASGSLCGRRCAEHRRSLRCRVIVRIRDREIGLGLIINRKGALQVALMQADGISRGRADDTALARSLHPDVRTRYGVPSHRNVSLEMQVLGGSG